MPLQAIEIPRVRYLCGLEENWDQPIYVTPLREEDAGWTTVKRRRAVKQRAGRRSETKKSTIEMVTELRQL